jgi:hypothetical protein
MTHQQKTKNLQYRIKNHFVTMIGLCFLSISLSACGSNLVIQGKVITSTGEELSGAQIRTEPTTQPVSTYQGHFVIKHKIIEGGVAEEPLKPIQYKLVINAVGYKELVIQVSPHEYQKNSDQITKYKLHKDEVEVNTDPNKKSDKTIDTTRERPPIRDM